MEEGGRLGRTVEEEGAKTLVGERNKTRLPVGKFSPLIREDGEKEMRAGGGGGSRAGI